MVRLFPLLLLLALSCYTDMNVQYCGVINQGLRGPVVLKAKSEECDIVLVDSCGIVVGVPGKYAVARALCKSMEVGDTLAVKVGEIECQK